VINGSNFAAGVVVAFSGPGITVNSTTRNNSGKITVNVTIAPAPGAFGASDVTVTNPDAGTVTLVGGFTVNQGPAFAAVNPVVPKTQARGTTQTITINGSGFVAGATVVISGTKVSEGSASVGGGGTTLTLSVTVQSSAATGFRNVTVTNLDGGMATVVNGYQIT